MTAVNPSDVIVSGLQELKNAGQLTPELQSACKDVVIPRTFKLMLPLLGVTYLAVVFAHYLAGNMASAVAALGPTLTAFYISNALINRK